MALTTNVSLEVIARLTGAGDLGNASAPLDYSKLIAMGDGTGLNQADVLWHDQRTLGSGANEDLDLAGSLTDLLGNAITVVDLKLVLFHVPTAGAGPITVSRPASNGVPLFGAASDSVKVMGGGAFLWVNPDATDVVTVTAGTGDLINVLNDDGAASVTYDVIIAGTSA